MKLISGVPAIRMAALVFAKEGRSKAALNQFLSDGVLDDEAATEKARQSHGRGGGTRKILVDCLGTALRGEACFICIFLQG